MVGKNRSRLRLQRGSLIACVSLLLLAGCQNWTPTQSKTPWGLGNKPTNVDTVRLEIGVAELDETQSEPLAAFWRLLDFQKLPLETRKRLDRCGLRVAVMSSRPPAVFAELMKPQQIEHDRLGQFDRQLYVKGLLKPAKRLISHTRVSSREGQSHPVTTSDVHDFLTWSTPLDNGFRPDSGNHVSGNFSISTTPLGDGAVRVTLVPEVHHGDHKKRYGSTEHGFNYVTTQQIQTLEAIQFDVKLRIGETLVVGPTADLAQMGKLFFAPVGNTGLEAQELENVPLAEIDTSLDALAAIESDLAQLDLRENDTTAAVNERSHQQLDDAIQKEIGQTETGQANTNTVDKLANATAESSSTSKRAALESLSDQALLEAEVREMLRVKPGEEVVLPKFDLDMSSPPPKPLHRLLLIRLIQTQSDDLFKAIDVVEPLTNVDRY